MIMNDEVLGNIIDNNLTWPQHVDKLCKNIKTNPWLLSRIRLLKEFNSIKHTYSPIQIIVKIVSENDQEIPQ